MNLYAHDLLDAPIGLALALLLGLGFGFWLERAGFGSSRKLTAIFYLRDFAVLKVMFSAMVTAALGLQALAAVGLVDLGSLYVPATVVWPQLVGGLLFGVGFVAGGWCPGTAAVGLASGRLDALVFLLGAAAGSLAFAGLAPGLDDFLHAGACDVGSLPERLGVSGPIGAAALLAVALLAFVGATLVERIMVRRNPA
ncbi:MAG: YeeE/YedE family protein [Planctomycetes bacterium]|nr:YeeE/YedE family protein [Planctomycetota bacterium]